MVSNIFQFYKNRRRESYSFIMSLNSKLNGIFGFPSNDLAILAQIKFGKVFKLRQRVLRLRSLV